MPETQPGLKCQIRSTSVSTAGASDEGKVTRYHQRRRPEIQGLRAVAVLLVFAFHLWPGVVPGGYVGVDVFFVISGFLICGGLLREVELGGSIALAAFYARRVRRLLPAATLVLAVVAAAVPLLPITRWEQAAIEIAASAVYAENWVLAYRAIDYFAIGTSATPVQHYWSLSVEEQFYLLWPLMMLATVAVARRLRISAAGTLATVFAAVAASSLAASVVLAFRSPEWGYFATQARLWELALGGLLAFLERYRRPAVARRALGMAGIVMIFCAAFAFSPATPFPGFAALLPTIGAALIILSGEEKGRSPLALLGTPPFRYLGDRSYSIYLWHWPAIVFYVALTRSTAIGPLVGLVIIAVVLTLSDLSWRYVEERFRRPRPDAGRPRAAWLPAAGTAGACVAAAVALFAASDDRPALATLAFDADHPGPAALTEGMQAPSGIPLRPTIAGASKDVTEATPLGCHQTPDEATMEFCEFGDPAGSVRIALVGDSHALQWVSALVPIVEQRGWRLRTYTKSGCAFAETTVVLFNTRPYEFLQSMAAEAAEAAPRQTT